MERNKERCRGLGVREIETERHILGFRGILSGRDWGLGFERERKKNRDILG